MFTDAYAGRADGIFHRLIQGDSPEAAAAVANARRLYSNGYAQTPHRAVELTLAGVTYDACVAQSRQPESSGLELFAVADNVFERIRALQQAQSGESAPFPVEELVELIMRGQGKSERPSSGTAYVL